MLLKSVLLGNGNSRKKTRLFLFLLLLMLLLAAVAACITFAAEISKLKSETASLKSELSKQSENYSALVEQLSTKLQECKFSDNEARNFTMVNVSCENNFTKTKLSCSSLPLSSPSGYYWVTASNGSAVRVYCDMTRSCGGFTGGWTRVAHLDMTDSRQQCPSEFKQHNHAFIRACVVNTSKSKYGCFSAEFPVNILLRIMIQVF